MTTRALLILAGALLPLSAAAAAPPAAPPAAPRRNVGGPGDYQLRERVVSNIKRDPMLATLPIQIAVANGAIVYSGEVPSCTMKNRLLRLAAVTRGVINVTDALRVTAADLPDETLAKAVEQAVRPAGEQLGLKDFSVAVHDSTATLEGTVDSFQARVQAEDLAGMVQGLTRIANHLRTADAPAATDDPSIVKSVVAYLQDFRNFGYPSDIEVAAAGGRVILTGRVGLVLARQQAGVVASLIRGVTAVENHLRVEVDFGPFVNGRARPTIVKARF
jgi:osmotically-inducible protein OsmY